MIFECVKSKKESKEDKLFDFHKQFQKELKDLACFIELLVEQKKLTPAQKVNCVYTEYFGKQNRDYFTKYSECNCFPERNDSVYKFLTLSKIS